MVRQRYLNLFIEECLKFCSSNQEAIEKVGPECTPHTPHTAGLQALAIVALSCSSSRLSSRRFDSHWLPVPHPRAWLRLVLHRPLSSQCS